MHYLRKKEAYDDYWKSVDMAVPDSASMANNNAMETIIKIRI